MNETIRKRLVFASLGLAIVYGTVTFYPFTDEAPKPSRLSTVAPLKANQVQSPGHSLINTDSMTGLDWGTDPFRAKHIKPPVKTAIMQSELNWHLSGILYSGDNPMAIINKKMVRTGDMVDNAKVIRIERKQVTLEYNGRKRTLTVSRG